jgi:hypothetical protein
LKKKLKISPLIWKPSTHVFGILRLNRGHGGHESVTRLGVFGVGNQMGVVSTSENGRFSQKGVFLGEKVES